MSKAVNRVNPRKEFFDISIDEIEKSVKMNCNKTLGKGMNKI